MHFCLVKPLDPSVTSQYWPRVVDCRLRFRPVGNLTGACRVARQPDTKVLAYCAKINYKRQNSGFKLPSIDFLRNVLVLFLVVTERTPFTHRNKK